MRRLILLLALVAVTVLALMPAPAVAQACADYDGWMACGALNDCEGYLLLRNKLECWKRCHFFYCVINHPYAVISSDSPSLKCLLMASAKLRFRISRMNSAR